MITNEMDVIENTPVNENGQAHGLWETYYGGELKSKCNYVNGVEVGYDKYVWGDGFIEIIYWIR